MQVVKEFNGGRNRLFIEILATSHANQLPARLMNVLSQW